MRFKIHGLCLVILPLLLSACAVRGDFPYTVSWNTIEEAENVLKTIRHGNYPVDFAIPDARFLGGEIQKQTLVISEKGGLHKPPLEEIGPHAEGYPLLSYSISGTMYGYSVEAEIIAHALPFDAMLSLNPFGHKAAIYVAASENRRIVKYDHPELGIEAFRFVVSISKKGEDLSESDLSAKAVSFTARCLMESISIL